jgi:hypothetical protein
MIAGTMIRLPASLGVAALGLAAILQAHRHPSEALPGGDAAAPPPPRRCSWPRCRSRRAAGRLR